MSLALDKLFVETKGGDPSPTAGTWAEPTETSRIRDAAVRARECAGPWLTAPRHAYFMI